MDMKQQNNWNVFLSYIKQAKIPKWMIAVALLLSLIETAGILIVPVFTGDIVDQFALGQLNVLLIAVLIGAFVLQAVAGAVSYYLMSYMGEWVVADVRKQLWRRILHLPISYFDASPSGETMSRMTHDTDTLKRLITDQLVSFVSGIITVLGAAIILLIIDWKMMLLMLLVVPLAIVVLHPAGQKMYQVSLKTQDEMASFSAGMARVLGDIRLVKAYNAEAEEGSRGTSAVDRLFRFGIRQAKILAIISPLMTMVMMIVLVLLIGYGGSQVASGALTAGTMVMMMLYLFQLIFPFTQLTSFFTEFQKAMGATERIQKLFSDADELQAEEQIKTYTPIPAEEQDIHFQHVSFYYPSAQQEEERVLTDINCTIPAGKVTAVVGPSGSGKTTMFGLLERFYQPVEGDILYGSASLQDVKLSDWRNQIGYVSQESPLMDGTIRENICYGLENVPDEQVRQAAELAYAADFIDGFPNGFETKVGERGMKLSGGQRQRIAIARALIRDPKILMLDEATSSLDSESERVIQKALQTLMKGRTTIAIAHRLSTVINADQIIMLEKGSITGIGKHEELLAEHPLYRKLAEQQFNQ
ncbi:ABC transporter ATP-binding protein [Halalkalibacter oceani]